MKFPLLTIDPDGSMPSRRNRYPKSRAFSCTLLRCVAWPAYRSDKRNLRPIFLDYCGTESEHRAFTANLRCGRPAALNDREAIELLRSEPYIYATPQRIETATGLAIRQVVYLPEVFDLECKAQRDEICLCVMPPARLLETLSSEEVAAVRELLETTNTVIGKERQRIEAENAPLCHWRRQDLPPLLDLDEAALQYWALCARELAVRLDARTRYPIPYAAAFRAKLLQTLLQRGDVKVGNKNPLLSLTRQRDEYRMPLDVRGPDIDYRTLHDCGYLPPLALRITQDDLGPLLAGLAKEYYQ